MLVAGRYNDDDMWWAEVEVLVDVMTGHTFWQRGSSDCWQKSQARQEPLIHCRNEC